MPDKKAPKKTLTDKLTFKTSSAWERLDRMSEREMEALARDYIAFLTRVRTEREAVSELVKMASARGFRDASKVSRVRPGDGLYIVHKGRGVVFAVAGSRPLSDGANIVASHVDCPRLDLKMNPVYGDKDSQTALLRTHYYGGIRKYHWVNIPLELRGVVSLDDGRMVDVKMDDVCLVVPDIEPHLGKRQGEKTLDEAFTGEGLQALAGSRPATGKNATDDPLAMSVLQELNRRLGIKQENLVSAELTLVPSWAPRDVGFDRSMIGAYGQDDRVNAFLGLAGLLTVRSPKRWSMSVSFDKEETGSDGPGGAQTRMLASAFSAFLEAEHPGCPDRLLRQTLENSRAISADVKTGVDPTFKSVHDLRNAARLGRGPTITKYTGARGKVGANDARAEFVGHVRRIMHRAKIPFQVSETGKVDEGGGGTVAKFLAQENMDVLDIGVPILSMHSPYEVTCKADLEYTRRFYRAFYEDDSELDCE